MSLKTRIAKQGASYLVGELLLLISGLISFPIFTRVFTKSEYGIMSLVTLTLSLSELLASGGLRTAIFRFHGEFKERKRPEELASFYSTMIISSMFLGLLLTCILISIRYIVSLTFFDKKVLDILSFAAFLVFFRITSKIILAFYRADEKSLFFNIIRVLQQYFGLVLAIIFVVYMSKGLYGLYGGLLIAEGLFSIFLMFIMLRKFGKNLLNFSMKIFIEAFKYGFPLVGQNMASFINDSGDKYMISYFLGSAEVGVYSVGYRLATYAYTLVVQPFNSTIIPISMNIWAKEGIEETQAFISKLVKYYLLIAIPIIFGISALGKDVLYVLASSKYVEAAVVIPWIITGLMINGGYFIFMGGLYFEKKTMKVALLLFAAAAVNIFLNLFLIPEYGITGAAIATLISCSIYGILGIAASRKYLRIPIPILEIVKYVLLSLVMYFVINSFVLSCYALWLVLLVKIIIGIAVYILLLLMFDLDFRKQFLIAKNRLLQR